MVEPIQGTVLVVEDNDEISLQIEILVARKGFRAVIAADASQAIEIAEVNRPALILTDLDLPTFNLLVQNIRTHAALSDLPIAVIDINSPELGSAKDVKVLNDFDQLDQLLASAIRH